ncbi:MAG: hypothetical protein AB1393_00850 [Candidatus Edwardsbacteria bacterium]
MQPRRNILRPRSFNNYGFNGFARPDVIGTPEGLYRLKSVKIWGILWLNVLLLIFVSLGYTAELSLGGGGTYWKPTLTTFEEKILRPRGVILKRTDVLPKGNLKVNFSGGTAITLGICQWKGNVSHNDTTYKISLIPLTSTGSYVFSFTPKPYDFYVGGGVNYTLASFETKVSDKFLKAKGEGTAFYLLGGVEFYLIGFPLSLTLEGGYGFGKVPKLNIKEDTIDPNRIGTHLFYDENGHWGITSGKDLPLELDGVIAEVMLRYYF